MNTTDPSDYAPLHYGPGLVLGLMLILGLPGAPHTPRPKQPRYGCDPAGRPPPTHLTAFARSGWEPQGVHGPRAQAPAARERADQAKKAA
ncbi:MAG TPA: hypothetical protein VHE13_01895 [Opitutus sp.]|nr:hypothetical protein [Opitutus sp.]